MPGYLMTDKSIVKCAHQGVARPAPGTASPRVKILKVQAVVPVSSAYQVTGCTNQLPPPTSAPFPCQTAQWLPPTATLRVKSLGQPLLLADSKALCLPTGTPLSFQFGQQRVKAQ